MVSYFIVYLAGTYVLIKMTEDARMTVPLIVISIVSGLIFAAVRYGAKVYDNGLVREPDPGESAAIAAMAILVNLIATMGLSFFLHTLWY